MSDLRTLACLGCVVAAAAGCGEPSEPEQRATATATTSDGPAQRYIGLVYSDPPRGVKSLGGALIGGVFVVSHVQSGERSMLWLERLTSPPDAQIPRYQVIGVLAVPRLDAAEVVAIGTCEVGTSRHMQVVAIWPTKRGPEAPARLAWLADGRAGRFEPIDPRRVRCPEELANLMQ